MPEREKSVKIITMDYRVVEAEEQQGLESPCKKILLTARCGIGAPVKPDEFGQLILQVSHQLFPQESGWDLRKVSGEEHVTLTLAITDQVPDYSFEERRIWGDAAAQFLAELTYGVIRLVLGQAKAWIDAQRPKASMQKRLAFADSVCFLITGWAGMESGRSVREHAALRLYAEDVGKKTFEEALALLNRDDGLVFGPLTEFHRQCWEEEICFMDDPVDVQELTFPTGKA